MTDTNSEKQTEQIQEAEKVEKTEEQEKSKNLKKQEKSEKAEKSEKPEKKKKLLCVKIFVAVLVFVIAIVTIINIVNSKNYNKKIELTMQAIYSESKMDEALKSAIDVKGALAWNLANGDQKEFNNKLKEVKKDEDLIERTKSAFKSFSVRIKTLEPVENNIQKIEEPVKNGKVKEVKALVDDTEYKFIFYKDKIIDVINAELDESIFESIFYFYNINVIEN